MRPGQLTALEIKTIISRKKWGKHSDGGNLFLVGSEAYDAFSWMFMFKSPITGKYREMGLGSIHTFTLSEARDRATQLRKVVADGKDPIIERWAAKDAARAAAVERITFRDASRRFLDLHAPAWKNEKHRAQWESTLKAHAYRTLGERPALTIDGVLITEALAGIWQSTPETARRVKQRIERIVQWVKDGQPLPMQGASKRVKHHSALPLRRAAGLHG